MSGTYYVAWWNVESLFDYENSPRRTDKLRRALGSTWGNYRLFPEARGFRMVDMIGSCFERWDRMSP